MKDGIGLTKPFKVRELLVIKSIAETINQSNDLTTLLNAVLQKLVELTDIQAAWVFLAEECSNYYDQGTGYRFGEIDGADDYAAIPLMAGNRRFGVLKLAAEGKDYFHTDELTFMESIAFQIGTALERTMLYQLEQKRADLYAHLDSLTKELSKLLNTERIPHMVCSWLGKHIGCKQAAFYMEESGTLVRRMAWSQGRVNHRRREFPLARAEAIGEAYLAGKVLHYQKPTRRQGKVHSSGLLHDAALCVPLWFRDKPFGVMEVVFAEGRHADEIDVEVMEALSGHITLAFENARLYQQQLDLLKWEERNRLARDLHDSVSQMLFSLQFTAKGLEAMLQNPPDMVQRALKDMKELTQDALTEMRSLILQLRPVGLEQGLLTGLYRYGKAQGLIVINCVDCMLDLPSRVEEALFRIGQEALNNARKYAGHPQIQISLKQQDQQVLMEIKDQGNGFIPMKLDGSTTFGMRTMRERAESLGGTLDITSKLGEGTTILVLIPLSPGSERRKEQE